MDFNSNRVLRLKQDIIQLHEFLKNSPLRPNVSQISIWFPSSSMIFSTGLTMQSVLLMLGEKFSQFLMKDAEKADLELVDIFKLNLVLQKLLYQIQKSE